MIYKSKLDAINLVYDKKYVYNNYKHNYYKLYNFHTSDPTKKFVDLTGEDIDTKLVYYRNFVDLTKEETYIYLIPLKEGYKCRTYKVLDLSAKILVKSKKESFTSLI